jgi:hypothetical protein
MIQNNHLSRELKFSSIIPKKIFQKGEEFQFSDSRFLVVGSHFGLRGCLSWNCTESITNNCAHQVSKVVYNKISRNWPAVGPAIIIVVQITPPANLQSWWLTSSCKDGAVAKYCHKELSVWLLPWQSFVCHALFPCFTLTKLPAFFLLSSEHNGRPGVLSSWHPQVKLNGRGPNSFVCHALFPRFTLTKLP